MFFLLRSSKIMAGFFLPRSSSASTSLITSVTIVYGSKQKIKRNSNILIKCIVIKINKPVLREDHKHRFEGRYCE